MPRRASMEGSEASSLRFKASSASGTSRLPRRPRLPCRRTSRAPGPPRPPRHRGRGNEDHRRLRLLRIDRSVSRIWACTVTSRPLVGSSAMSTSGSLAMAIAITTRWRIPPESSCEPARQFARLGSPDHFEQLDGSATRRCPTQTFVESEALGNLRSDAVHRVECRHRVLEDHRHPGTADGVPLFASSPSVAPGLRGGPPAHFAAAPGGSQSDEGERCHGLARSGLADDAEGLPGS